MHESPTALLRMKNAKTKTVATSCWTNVSEDVPSQRSHLLLRSPRGESIRFLYSSQGLLPLLPWHSAIIGVIAAASHATCTVMLTTGSHVVASTPTLGGLDLVDFLHGLLDQCLHAFEAIHVILGLVLGPTHLWGAGAAISDDLFMRDGVQTGWLIELDPAGNAFVTFVELDALVQLQRISEARPSG